LGTPHFVLGTMGLVPRLSDVALWHELKTRTPSYQWRQGADSGEPVEACIVRFHVESPDYEQLQNPRALGVWSRSRPYLIPGKFVRLKASSMPFGDRRLTIYGFSNDRGEREGTMKSFSKAPAKRSLYVPTAGRSEQRTIAR
jgi:hypothetical protein